MAEQNQRKMTAPGLGPCLAVQPTGISHQTGLEADHLDGYSGESGRSGKRRRRRCGAVCGRDADGYADGRRREFNSSVTIPHLPYFRYQHGTAAIICDPKVGDLGLAVFAQQDCSRLTGDTTPQAPGTFRCFDMSDGFYVGGFWGAGPENLHSH